MVLILCLIGVCLKTTSQCLSELAANEIDTLLNCVPIPLHTSMGLCACLYVGWMVGGCLSSWYVCLECCIMALLIAKCLGLGLHTYCVWVYVCVHVCVFFATCPISCPRFIHWHKFLLATWLILFLCHCASVCVCVYMCLDVYYSGCGEIICIQSHIMKPCLSCGVKLQVLIM